MVLPIYIYGQPVLRKVAEDIPADYPELDAFIKDMWDTLADSEGIGLAAPQVGKSIRVVVIDLDLLSDDMPEYKDFRRVFINAHIVEYDDSETEALEEGCLSLPAIHEKVARPKRIRVQWLDEKMQPHDEWIEGYLARVFSRGTTARSVSLSWGARIVGSPCEWRGGARHCSRAMGGDSGLETC